MSSLDLQRWVSDRRHEFEHVMQIHFRGRARDGAVPLRSSLMISPNFGVVPLDVDEV